jgi:hypothetical protein
MILKPHLSPQPKPSFLAHTQPLSRFRNLDKRNKQTMCACNKLGCILEDQKTKTLDSFPILNCTTSQVAKNC